MLQRILLGPQRPITNLDSVFKQAAIPEGPIAVISTGWQEAEGDIDDVYQLVQRPLIDLKLYHRAEEIFHKDENFLKTYRVRQDQLKELQRLYHARLRQMMNATRKMYKATGSTDLIAVAQEHAMHQLRELDKHHLSRIADVYNDYAESLTDEQTNLIEEQKNSINESIKECSTVLITGGNVLIMLNRLQMFDMKDLLASRHIVAWSAGAMVLSDLIVLYHERNPLGRRDPEVVGPGMGILPKRIFLPDANTRLRESDHIRLGIFSQRFAPSECITLNNGSHLCIAEKQVQTAVGIETITSAGEIKELTL